MTRPTLEALELGCLVRRALADGGYGRVAAVFEHSLYIAAPRQWMCVGPASMGSGPMNVRCRAAHAPDWRAGGVRVNHAVRIEPHAVYLGPGLILSLAGVRTWMPHPPPGAPSRGDLRVGLERLDAAIDARIPAAGVGVLAHGARSADHLSAVALAALEPAARLHALLRAAFGRGETPAPQDLDCVESLLGLGPGLTPSGDDFVVGALIALHLLGRDDLRDALWRSVRARMPPATNEISGAHLSAAAQGLASAALHDILNDILSGKVEGLDARITAIDAIGHTSGWDGLAGAATVLRAWLDVRVPRDAGPLRVRSGEPAENAG
ncbi:MAG: DUF2877 domain-containing protein [Gammaproteobacteria bacterium]|nr:DUF2877 domain-containing protein [Gammaproteobacteria bacterium]NIR83218.1 DUF2877 domain-containing protein [Gammaproteobacteria bacterium]NIR91026.1 DUF2877 domain-containing protein [Gammaproteobacteria bacterium]NIU04383.1 DUF2877 domain-containing protein [Gammaproteobacteria bacterium]NIV52606.1 DUF2877 domain-containing protein [Gammaproteobacteria bacterium]